MVEKVIFIMAHVEVESVETVLSDALSYLSENEIDELYDDVKENVVQP